MAARLGEKLERAQQHIRKDSAASGGGEADAAAAAVAAIGRLSDEGEIHIGPNVSFRIDDDFFSLSGEPILNVDSANERIRELELELAQTKLALVETECKNQDLAAPVQQLPPSQPGAAAAGGQVQTNCSAGATPRGSSTKISVLATVPKIKIF